MSEISEIFHIRNLEKRLREVEDYFKKVDRDGGLRREWARLASVLKLEVETKVEETTAGFLQRVHKRLEELRDRSAGKDLKPFELFFHLVLAFLEGPLSIVLSDIHTEFSEAEVLRKLKRGEKLTPKDIEALDRGIVNLHGSALYPLGYRYVYRYFDALAKGLAVEPPDDLPTYPPTEDLIDLCADIDRLAGEISDAHALVDEAKADPTKLDDPQYLKRLEKALEDDPVYVEFRDKTKQLIKMVIGPAATGFLVAALESIPKVEGYFKRVWDEAEAEPSRVDRDYVKYLKEAPPYLRALIYVAEANDDGHSIDGARIPFPVKTSETVNGWIDGMVSKLFGAKAPQHPFFSSKRAAIEALHPLDVNADYQAEK